MSSTARRSALVVVDAQHDFTEGWALPVVGGAAVCDRIADELGDTHHDLVFATYDWHPADAPFHFVDDGAEPDFHQFWPPHCIAGTEGAEYPPVLHEALDAVDAVRLYKGQTEPGYSGFQATIGQDGSGPALADLLDEAGITDVAIAGLALDVCVAATVHDALAWAVHLPARAVSVRRDLTAPVIPDAGERTVEALAQAGASIRHGRGGSAAPRTHP